MIHELNYAIYYAYRPPILNVSEVSFLWDGYLKSVAPGFLCDSRFVYLVDYIQEMRSQIRVDRYSLKGFHWYSVTSRCFSSSEMF